MLTLFADMGIKERHLPQTRTQRLYFKKGLTILEQTLKYIKTYYNVSFSVL